MAERPAGPIPALPYQCPHCDKAFASESAVNYHVRGRHALSSSAIRFAQRHGSLCIWCGKPVVLDDDKCHPLAPSREHLIPRALNGSGVSNNIALAHRRCNELRQHAEAEAFKRLMRGEAVTKFELWPHLFDVERGADA